MSDGELKPGTAIFLRHFKDHPNENVQLNFPAPKERGRYHLAIWLGTWIEGESTSAERLNAMGWFYDPERAAQVGTHPQGGDAKQAPGDSLSDAVPEGDAPDTSPIPTNQGRTR